MIILFDLLFLFYSSANILSKHLEECKELMESCFFQTRKKYTSAREKKMSELEK